MRYLLIFFLCTSVFLASCSREDTIDDTQPDEIVDNPPVEVEVGDINGIVKDNNGELLSAATVKLYNETELITETTTNSFGEFDFVDVLQDDEYKIYVLKESYFSSITFVSDDHFNDEEVEVGLILGVSTSPFGQPTDLLDPNFILLYGDVINAEGSPLNLSIFIISFDGSFFYQGEVKDGQYAILVPKGKELGLGIFEFDSGGCILFPEQFFIGPYESDTKEDFQSNQTFTEYEFSGTVTVCDSTALQGGTLEYFLSNGESGLVNIDKNGLFDFEVSTCNIETAHYQIFDEFDSMIYSGLFDLEATINNIKVDCNAFGFDSGVATITYNNGQSEIEFDVIAFSADNFLDPIIVAGIPDELYQSDLLLVFNKNNQSSPFVEEFQIDLNGVDYFLNDENPVVIDCEITVNSMFPNNGELTASFSALLVDFSGFNTIEVSVEIDSPIFIE